MQTEAKSYLALYCCDTTNNQPTTVMPTTTAGVIVRSIVISGTANYTNTNFNPSNSPFGTFYSALFFTAILKASVIPTITSIGNFFL